MTFKTRWNNRSQQRCAAVAEPMGITLKKGERALILFSMMYDMLMRTSAQETEREKDNFCIIMQWSEDIE